MNIRNALAVILVLAIPSVAFAGTPVGQLPEPETMALLGIGAAALIIARWRRNK